jgi:DNA end-binding protein Ku
MRQAGVIGIARVVMHTKEHLAALIPSGPALILNTIRWASEIRPVSELKLPADGKAATNLKPGELKMAAQLISDMTGKWKPADYTENFSAAVHKLVNRKVKAGETESVTPVEDGANEERSSNVIDLTELLARSLKRKTNASDKASPSAKPKDAQPPKKAAAKPPVRKRA